MFFLKSFLWQSDSEGVDGVQLSCALGIFTYGSSTCSFLPKAVRYGNRHDHLNAGRWVGILVFLRSPAGIRRQNCWWFPSDQGLWSGAKNAWAQNRLMVGSCGRIQALRFGDWLSLQLELMKSAVWTWLSMEFLDPWLNLFQFGTLTGS
jgi:hypothetical protein